MDIVFFMVCKFLVNLYEILYVNNFVMIYVFNFEKFFIFFIVVRLRNELMGIVFESIV